MKEDKKMRLVPYIHRSLIPSTSGFFEELFDGFPITSYFSEDRHRFMPSVDVMEKDGNLILHAELPGMTEKEIDLRLEGNTLTLKGEKKMENEDKKSSYHRLESFHGSFTRSFRLPDEMDLEKIKAEYKNGVLTVTIPRIPEVKPREIPVSVH
jgi:HSP20 family protein